MNIKYLYAQARANGRTASGALDAVRRYTAGPLADYRAKLAAWKAEPDKRRYAPGGYANRPKMPTFYAAPREIALREADAPRWLGHTGWFTDDQQDNMLRPRVWRLPHGRFMAGYDASDWGAVRTCGRIYDDAYDAWRAADSMAESDAEEAREHDEHWQAASLADSERDEAREALRAARMDARAALRAVRELRAAIGDCDAVEQTRVIVTAKYRAARASMRRALADIASAAETIEAHGRSEDFA